VLAQPDHPLGLLLGGVNVERKLLLVEHLLPQLDVLCVGGLVGLAMLKGAGLDVRCIDVDAGTAERVARIIAAIRERPGFRLVMPETVIATDGLNRFSMSPVQVPEGWSVVDTGAPTERAFEEALGHCRMVIWNGPLGLFRKTPFDYATLEAASFLSNSPARTIAAGGETASAIVRSGRWDQFTHVSTGGATTLRLLAGIAVPGLDALPTG
jgi:phosphoglycerate kinase